jgi:hypothetical protein
MKQEEIKQWLKHGDNKLIASVCKCLPQYVSRALSRPSKRSTILTVAELLAEKRKEQFNQKFASEQQ